MPPPCEEENDGSVTVSFLMLLSLRDFSSCRNPLLCKCQFVLPTLYQIHPLPLAEAEPLLRNSGTYFSWQIPYLAHQSSFHASSWDPWLPSELHQGCRNLSSSFCFPVGHLQGTANEEMYADITLMQSWN